jgi:phage baseplate assembly protein W
MAHRTIEEIERERNTIISDGTSSDRMYFFDINKDGIIAAKTRNSEGASDIAVVTNESAVVESVYNIVLTEPGEKVMDPKFGCALDRFLFEPIDDVTARAIVESVSTSIELFEPRLLDFDVIVTALPDQNTFEIEIVLEINTSEEPIVIDTSLEKLR